MTPLVRRERPEDSAEVFTVIEFGFRSATGLGLLRPDPRIPDPAWVAIPLGAYDPAIRGRVVYPPFFPGPPADA